MTTTDNKAVFLDRDGTLIQERHYLKDPNRILLIDRVIPALRLLQENGYLLIIVTNQSGIGRGIIEQKDYELVRESLDNIFKSNNVYINETYHCPHHPTEGKGPFLKTCDCRKPKPGLIHQAMNAFNISPKGSFMIGDKLTDLQSGKAADVKDILVRTGYGKKTLENLETYRPDYVAEDVYDAVVNHILI